MYFKLFTVHLYLYKRTSWSCNRILLLQFYQQYANQSVSYYPKVSAYYTLFHMLLEYTERILQQMMLDIGTLL